MPLPSPHHRRQRTANGRVVARTVVGWGIALVATFGPACDRAPSDADDEVAPPDTAPLRDLDPAREVPGGPLADGGWRFIYEVSTTTGCTGEGVDEADPDGSCAGCWGRWVGRSTPACGVPALAAGTVRELMWDGPGDPTAELHLLSADGEALALGLPRPAPGAPDALALAVRLAVRLPATEGGEAEPIAAVDGTMWVSAP
jgi:hypothetical protein